MTRCAGPLQDRVCGAWECRFGIYPGLEDQLVECTECEGTGAGEDDLYPCEACAGRGKVLADACEACGHGDAL